MVQPRYYPTTLTSKPVAIETLAFSDARNTSQSLDRFSSGRIAIFRAAVRALGFEPAVLLRGNSSEKLIVLTNTDLSTPQTQFHNFFLQALMLTGIPGLTLVFAICIGLLVKAIRIIVSQHCSLAEKVLTLPLIGSLVFGQFEAGFFNYTDARPLFFYLICGMVLGCYADCFRMKQSATL